MPINQSKFVGTTDDVDKKLVGHFLQYVLILYSYSSSSFLPTSSSTNSHTAPDQMVSLKDFPTLDKPSDSLKVTDPKTGETGYRVGLEVFPSTALLEPAPHVNVS